MNKLFTLRTDVIRQRVQMWLSSLQIDPEHPLEVVVRDHEPQKTHEQRKTFHLICREIGRELGHPPAQIKEAIKADWFGIETYQIKDKWYSRVQSSEEPKRGEYSELIDFALMWGAERGVMVEIKAA